MKEFISVLAGLGILWLTFPIFYRDKDDLIGAIKFWFTPDIFSAFRGEYWQEQWSEFKLIIWFICGVAVGFGVYRLFA